MEGGECDVAVVGAGIVGLAVARELLLRRPSLRVAVLEREREVAGHQTGHTSGVVHAGVYYRPGSLKARLCVEGARLLYEYCEEGGIPYERCGKAIVAVREDELGALAELERRARANGVPGVRRIGPAELRELEPHAEGLAALHSPSTGIVDFARVARALAADVAGAGGRLLTGAPVTAIEQARGAALLRLPRGRGGPVRARRVVACAGLWADRLAVAAGAPSDPRIVPFRGAFLRLRPERRELVRNLIYPVPDPALPFLGAHLSRGIDGEVTIGPTALPVASREAYRLAHLSPRDLASTLAWPGTWRMAFRHRRAAARELRHALSRRALVVEARRYVPELRAADVLPGPAGVRAQAVARDGTLLDDFLVSETPRALHIRNAPSPAATSALALARLISDRLEAA